MKVLLGMGCLASLLAGCVSGAVNGAGEFQWGYHEEYTLSEKNRQALMNLRQGMSLDEVRAVMGGPQMVEQYPSETIWYYRTKPAGHVSQILCADVGRLKEVRIKRPGSRTVGLVLGPAFLLA